MEHFPIRFGYCNSKTEIDHIPNLDSHREREIEKERLNSSSVIMDCNKVWELSATTEEDFFHDSWRNSAGSNATFVLL
jgi:hypothetical protein